MFEDQFEMSSSNNKQQPLIFMLLDFATTDKLYKHDVSWKPQNQICENSGNFSVSGLKRIEKWVRTSLFMMMISVLMNKCINLYISGLVSMSYYLNISYWSFESFRLRSKIIFSVKGESGEVKQAVKLTVLEISGINLSLTLTQSIQLDKSSGMDERTISPSLVKSEEFTTKTSGTLQGTDSHHGSICPNSNPYRSLDRKILTKCPS